jgi:hypothetical protein
MAENRPIRIMGAAKRCLSFIGALSKISGNNVWQS